VQKTLNELAVILNGRVAGDGDVLISRVRGIEESEKGDLTFIANPKYLKKIKTTSASAILASAGIAHPGKNLLIVDDPYVAFGRALALFHPEDQGFSGLSPQAVIEKSACVSKEATLYPGVYVGHRAKVERGAVLYPGVYIGHDAVISENAILYSNVSVYRRCLIGRRVILHAGVVVGSDGFGFARPGWENVKIPQIGIVQIDDDVEVGANTTIDRAAIGRTWIQRGVKIDNLVQIGHNVVIGEYAVIVAQVGISGSTKIGKGVMLGGQSALVGHIEIGDHVMVAARSGVHKDIPQGQVVAGSPHKLHRDWLRTEACISRLPEMRNTMKALLRRVEILEARLHSRGGEGD
jgi:UDP-3-O-[3-hydroxymyristoyl] glucosamine N-acyltransferase